MPRSPDLIPALCWIHHVTLVRRIHAIVANAVMPAAHKRYVLGVRPAKRHRRPSRTTAFHSHVRQVWSIPNLFGQHAACVGEIFHRPDELLRVAPGGKLVVPAFSCQNRPASAHAGSIVSAAVIFLAVAVVIITTPARALRQVVL